MTDPSKIFNFNVTLAVNDENRYETLMNNISEYNKAIYGDKDFQAILNSLKPRAYAIKENVINNLEEYLKEFEKNFTLNGGKIIWANDTQTACESIAKLLKDHKIKSIVKTESLEADEIEIVKYLQQKKFDVTNTSIGDFINNIAGESRSSITNPIFHKNFEEIANLFHHKFSTPENITPSQLIDFIRGDVRSHLETAQASITGVDFLIANNGNIIISGEEGDQFIASSIPKIQIAIAGIERIIPSIKDLETFQMLLEYYKNGRKFPIFENIITSPKKSNEKNGVEELYLVILNNGRDQILNRINQRKALYCIKCGACATVCPVYQSIGGQCYDNVYSGPIATVTLPLMKGIKNYQHFCFDCTLCGKCSEICPVGIPIHELVLYNRYYLNKLNEVAPPLKLKSKRLTNFLQSRKKMNRKKFFKNYFMRKIFNINKIPFSDLSFNQLYEQRFRKE